MKSRETKSARGDFVLYDRLQNRLEKNQTRRSNGIVAPTAVILDWSRRLWATEDIPSVVVPNMIDVERTRRLSRLPLPNWFPRQRPVVLFFGRLEVRKGVRVLAKAMRAVWEESPAAQLLFVGQDGTWSGGRMSEELRRLAGDRAQRLHFVGHQPAEALFPVLNGADVVVLPSLWENFSLAALEAMALGCPMILTTGSGFEEFFQNARDGLLVPPGDANKLSAALRELLGRPGLRKSYGSQAAITARRYDVKPISMRFAAFIRSLQPES